jgi:Spx/MgsR family transcriptional regulator
MMVKVYGITTCGSVKKALTFLKAHQKAYAFIDLKSVQISEQKRKEWLLKQSMSVLFNTKGTKFKILQLDKNMSDAQKEAWLGKEQLLYKRPVIECEDGSLVVGFDEETYQKKFA